MYKLVFYPKFLRKSAKLTDGNLAFSSKITGDLRVIWDFGENEIRVIELLDIGGHSGKNKVYR